MSRSPDALPYSAQPHAGEPARNHHVVFAKRGVLGKQGERHVHLMLGHNSRDEELAQIVAKSNQEKADREINPEKWDFEPGFLETWQQYYGEKPPYNVIPKTHGVTDGPYINKDHIKQHNLEQGSHKKITK